METTCRSSGPGLGRPRARPRRGREAGGLGDGEVGHAPGRVARGRLGDAEGVEHHLGAEPAGGERDGGGAAGAEVLACAQAMRFPRPWRGRERVDPIVVGVVGGGAVGRSTRRPPGRSSISGRAWRAVIRWCRWRAEEAEAVREVVLPDRLVHSKKPLAAQDVVDEDVEPAPLRPYPCDQRRDRPPSRWSTAPPVARPAAARPAPDSDRLGAAVFGARRPRRATGDIDRRAGGAESAAMPWPARRVAPATSAMRPVRSMGCFLGSADVSRPDRQGTLRRGAQPRPEPSRLTRLRLADALSRREGSSKARTEKARDCLARFVGWSG